MTSFVSAFILFCAATSAFAFDAQITSQCNSGNVTIRVTVTDPAPPTYPHPDAYGGYTVIRHGLGVCDEAVMLTEYSIDFEDDIEIVDQSNSAGTPSLYAIHTVDLLGGLGRQVGGDSTVASTSCSGLPSVMGTVERWSYVGYVVRLCGDTCWLPEWAGDGEIVANSSSVLLEEYVGTEVELGFYGSIGIHWEMGVNIFVDAVEPVECGPVETGKQSWSDMKARYR